MPNVQIGKYTRPGIYIEEYDSSVIETPNVDGLQTLIIGSSKRGPVNTPVYLTSQTDLQNIYGDLDRTLESKGSYFHRTISKVLETSSVVAMNLLNPDDDLDQIEYQSISTSSGNINDIKRDGTYRRFFDTSSFWKKDREAFLALTDESPDGNNPRILHLTNMNDREVTVFIVKTSVTGYDKSLLEWYGSVDKVPFYVDSKDYASDYMVDVVILGGDWTNYNELSIDPIWNKYFTSEGLIKTELFNLSGDTSVNTLYEWRGLSLIPYFRDGNGSNIFIENKMNERSDRTGVFCAFDMDAVETDFRNGLLDLVGNSLINTKDDEGLKNQEEIEFLSYKENITETLIYTDVLLDIPSNTYQLTYDSHYQIDASQKRRALFAEGFIAGLTGPDAGTTSGGTVSGVGYGTYSLDFITSDFTDGDSATYSSYAVIGGVSVDLSNTSFDITADDFITTSTVTGTTQSFTEVFFIDTDGGIKQSPTNTQKANGVILGYLDVIINHDGSNVKYIDSTSYTPVSVDTGQFIFFDGINDITATVDGTQDAITYEFLGTTGGIADTSDYETYRRWKVYYQLISVLNNSNSYMSTILTSEGTATKKSIDDLIVTFTSDSVSDNTITLSGFGAGVLSSSILESSGLVLHTVDSEMLLGDYGMVTTEEYIGATYGVVARYSDLYSDYNNGKVNTGDYFTDIALTEERLLRFYKTDDILSVAFTDETLQNEVTTTNTTLTVTSQDSNFKQSVEVEMPVGYVRADNVVLIDGGRYPEVKIGDFLEQVQSGTASLEIGEVPRKMTRILSKKLYSGDTSLLEIVCDSAIKVYDFAGDLQTFRFTQIDDYVSTYKGISLFGFRVRQDSMPDGTDDRLEEILDIVKKGTPLYNALTDKDIIDYRYLVDSYGLGLTEFSKQHLTDICGKRLDVFGILNMPSMKQFRNSSSPTFVDDEGRLLTEYIALGGDPESTPAFNYSLAEGDGITCVGYFTPYVIVNDNGRPRNVPPSAWVATTFLRKHNTAITNVTPWTVAAGITDGQVTGIAGLEYSFTGEDISNLNGMKVNPIISKRNRGRVIETENTAQTLVTSALSFIHVREVLIELERDLSDMLLLFQWKYNTPEIRAEIKLRADSICADYVNRNGLYNFFNKCDAENNTQEIIDNQMGVLDSYIEPIKSMGIIVNNITILRTGNIDSGGFL